jgi:hypothetical protein
VLGSQEDTQSIRVYVSKKLPMSAVEMADRIPSNIDGIPTDIIETPAAVFLGGDPACSRNPRARSRPLIAGTSVAHPNTGAGTIACFCRSSQGDSESVYILSNNHVLANINRANIEDPILQPGPADGGVMGDAIAQLTRFVELQMDPTKSNLVDAALAKVNEGLLGSSPEICCIGYIRGVANAVAGMDVRMHGRTSGLIQGVVSDESVDAKVGTDSKNPEAFIVFDNQIRVEFASPCGAGDSGGLVVAAEGQAAVGLFFAGPQNGSYGWANPIEVVLNQLNCSLA